ncbi:MAG TPA: hypothetical protein VIX18_10180 [Nitrospirota bacterium]
MFMQIVISLFLLFVSLCFTRETMAQTVYDASNFSASGRLLQPPPSGHTPGKDNGPGVGTHNAGEDCGICHTPGGKAGNFVFTVGGTVYEDRSARRPLKGAEIILQDINGTTISMTSNAAGNFWTFAPIAGNPCAMSSHGSTLDYLYTLNNNVCVPTVPSSDSRTWQYKAWVKYGDQVRHMATIAPIGGSSATTARMGCSMHHAGLGSRGGLWGMKKDTLASYPASGMSFRKHILPIFRNKCAPCHIPGSTLTRIATRSDIDPTATGTLTVIDYSKAQDLTSYAGSTVGADVKIGVGNLATAYQSDPDSSPLLSHTLLQSAGTVTHGGGGFWTRTDGDYKAIRQWIAEGAKP